MLYTAKGTGALLVPLAAVIAKSSGWPAVFSIAMTFNVIAGLLALFVLKPLRARHFAKSRQVYAAEFATTAIVAVSSAATHCTTAHSTTARSTETRNTDKGST